MARSALAQPTTLYYKVQAYPLRDQALEDRSGRAATEPMLEKDQVVVVDRLIEVLSAKSLSPERFTALLIQSLLPGSSDPDAQFLLSTWEEEPHKVILAVLGRAGIPAYEIRGIRLEDGRRRQTLSALVEIYNGDKWWCSTCHGTIRAAPGLFYLAAPRHGNA